MTDANDAFTVAERYRPIAINNVRSKSIMGVVYIKAITKTFTFLYDKFTQDNMYQNLSQPFRFCRLYMKKKHFGVFFPFTVYYYYYYYFR